MRILQVASEVHPYSKSGGLADMVGALSRTLAFKGHPVDVVTPAYRGIRKRFPAIKEANWRFGLWMGNQLMHGEFLLHEVAPGHKIWFVDRPEFFDRTGLYNDRQVDYPDNDARFIFFSKAALLLARYLVPAPDVVQCHDWQSGLLPLFIHHAKVTDRWAAVPAVLMTIHNLEYQGWFPAQRWGLTNLPISWFHVDGALSYGQMNFLKAGLHLADAISTVSPRYAREICTPAFGCGLDWLLRRREYELTGILNGVDYDEWNTQRNPALHQAYSIDSLAGKWANKQALQLEMGLSQRPDLPLFANISRLTGQKGVDLQLTALRQLAGEGSQFQFVLLGSGDPILEQEYRDLATAFPSTVAVRIGFDPALSHRIEAGADFYLMPSRFEPCGLNQLYSLRYGTIPIVRATGGLDDSVIDSRESAEQATGIKFEAVAVSDLVNAIRQAFALYADPSRMAHYRHNAMRADFSWDRQVGEYLALYEHLLHEV